MSKSGRGWAIAVGAMAVCAATWVGVVRDDPGGAEGLLSYRAVAWATVDVHLSDAIRHARRDAGVPDPRLQSRALN